MKRNSGDTKGTVVGSRSVTNHPDGSRTVTRSQVLSMPGDKPIPDPPARPYQTGFAPQRTPDPKFQNAGEGPSEAAYQRDLQGVPHQQGSPSKVLPSTEIDVLNGSNGNDNSGDLAKGRYQRMTAEIEQDRIVLEHDSEFFHKHGNH
jgi:hypothetical protein